MDKLKIIPKIFLLITAVFFTIWLGSYIARQIVIYQLFEPIDLNLRPQYNSGNLPAIYSTVVPLIILNVVTYIIFISAFIIFILSSRINLKVNGWLFIILVIVLITAPFEIYLSVIDFNIISAGFNNYDQSPQLISLIKERLTKLSSFSLIEIFSYLAIIYLALFKPFQKQYEN